MLCFAHISDLHFGDKLANSGRGVTKQRPHDIAKCLALPSGINLAMDEAKMPDDAELRVIASGDLSVSGSMQQLAVAHAFLRSEVSISRLPAPYGVMGLNVSGDRLGVIPGNHDHWAGNRSALCPYNGNLFDEQFRFTPWVKPWSSYQGDFEVDVFGVDTDSGWNPNPPGIARRFQGGVLAQGRISDPEFAALEKQLATSSSKSTPTVRTIVCHHSLSYRGGRLGTLELETASRDTLLDLAGKYRVAAILTGHTHDSHYESAQRANWMVTELRCGSTVGWPEVATDKADFLFHCITRADRKWTWTVWRFGWVGGGYACWKKGPWKTFDGPF